MSLSASLAAAREAKKKKQYLRSMNKSPTFDRNKIAGIERIQSSNRRKMITGGDLMSIDDVTTIMIRGYIHYGELVYGHNVDSANVFEHIIRVMRVVAVLCRDEELSALTDLSQQAMERNAVEKDLSPNQRRALLAPLIKMLDKANIYYSTLPDKTIQEIEAYSAALQVVVFTTRYFDSDIQIIKAVNQIIRGESIRKLAKEMGEKENILREKVIDSAYCLYKIAVTVTYLRWKNSITQLRDDAFSLFADSKRFHDTVKTATECFLLPFEEKTGIMLLDSRKLIRKIPELYLKAN